MDKQIITKSQMIMRIAELSANLEVKEQECEELRGVIRKDICSHYVLGECSQKHHSNCVGRNQCIKDLEQECEFSNLRIIQLQETLSQYETELDQLKAEIKYQRNFIDSLLLATNNSEWSEKSILDEEASEIIEKIEMDYVEFEEGKEINAELKAENEHLAEKEEETRHYLEKAEKFKNCLTEIKENAEESMRTGRMLSGGWLSQKISEVENV